MSGLFQSVTARVNALIASLAATVSAGQGAGQVGFLYTLAYGAGTVGAWLQNLATSAGASFIGWIQLGTGAVLRTILAKLQDHVSALDFGMSTANTAAQNSTALSAAITYCLANGKALYIPGSATAYALNTVSLTYAGAATTLRIFGDSAGNYNAGGIGSVLQASTAGDLFDLVGTGPVNVEISNLTFRGAANANGLKISSAWMVKVLGCAFQGFSSAGYAAVAILAGANSFAGNVTIERCTFESNYYSILMAGATGGEVNVIRILYNEFLDGYQHIASNWGAVVPFTNHVLIFGCSFQNASNGAIYSGGAAQNWTVESNYYEFDGSTFIGYWVDFEGATNLGISVKKNSFVGTLNAAGQSFVRVLNGTGIEVTQNEAANGGLTDRFAADFVTCTSVKAAPPATASAAPYPVRVNNYVIQSGEVNDQWLKSLTTGSGNFNGISTGDGWPGASVNTLNTSQFGRVNARVFVEVDTVLTTKSASGGSVLLGLLPYSNAGGTISFPAFTTGITGTQPFHFKLAGGATFATLYDATDTAVPSSAMSAGATVKCSFNYPTQG